MSDTKRQDNLQTYQKGIQYGQGNGTNTGGPDPLNSQADKIKIAVSEGKSGSSESSKVQNFAKGEGELK